MTLPTTSNFRWLSTLLGSALYFAFGSTLSAQLCSLADVQDPAVTEWSNQLIAAITGADACYATPDAFRNSDCNIFVGRVLEQAYGVNDFRATPGSAARYLTSNEIAVSLPAGLMPGWKDLDLITDPNVLQRAQQLANQRTPVLAVWPNPNGPGHVVLVGQGPMTTTGSLGQTPVSASFFQGHPDKNYIGKPLSCGFNSTQRATAKIFARTDD